MDWMKLKDLQGEANRIGRPICAWTPKALANAPSHDNPEREYIIDKMGKPNDGKYPKVGLMEISHSYLHVFQPVFTEIKVGPPSSTVVELVPYNDQRKNPIKVKFRTMTLEEAKSLSYGDHIWFIRNDGKAGQVKINGAPKTWKKTPRRVAIPVKYGMYEYNTFTQYDLHRMLIRLED